MTGNSRSGRRRLEDISPVGMKCSACRRSLTPENSYSNASGKPYHKCQECHLVEQFEERARRLRTEALRKKVAAYLWKVQICRDIIRERERRK